MIPRDKVAHVGLGIGTALGGYWAGTALGAPSWVCLLCGATTLIGVSVGKELADTQTTGFSYPDLAADAAGGIPILLLLALTGGF